MIKKINSIIKSINIYQNVEISTIKSFVMSITLLYNTIKYNGFREVYNEISMQVSG